MFFSAKWNVAPPLSLSAPPLYVCAVVATAVAPGIYTRQSHFAAAPVHARICRCIRIYMYGKCCTSSDGRSSGRSFIFHKSFSKKECNTLGLVRTTRLKNIRGNRLQARAKREKERGGKREVELYLAAAADAERSIYRATRELLSGIERTCDVMRCPKFSLWVLQKVLSRFPFSSIGINKGRARVHIKNIFVIHWQIIYKARAHV